MITEAIIGGVFNVFVDFSESLSEKESQERSTQSIDT